MMTSNLTKGQIRKLNALRKALGNKIADATFSKWLKTQNRHKSQERTDPVAKNLEGALKPLASKKINFGTYGYTIKRAKGKGAKGIVVTRNNDTRLGIKSLPQKSRTNGDLNLKK